MSRPVPQKKVETRRMYSLHCLAHIYKPRLFLIPQNIVLWRVGMDEVADSLKLSSVSFCHLGLLLPPTRPGLSLRRKSRPEGCIGSTAWLTSINQATSHSTEYCTLTSQHGRGDRQYKAFSVPTDTLGPVTLGLLVTLGLPNTLLFSENNSHINT